MALRFVHSQLFVTLPVPKESYTGQTIIITGSNTGLGLEAARHFTRLGASTVILAVRSLSKGEAAKSDIEATTKRHDVIKVMHLDMSSYDSVLEFAAKCADLPRIDIAILNAGVARGVWETAEGHESTITVNVISTFLLAFSLLPHLIATSKQYNTKPTLSITASEVHEYAEFVERKAPQGQLFKELDNPKDANGKDRDMGERYQVSKLLEVLAIRAMAEKHPDVPVTINCLNPGLCHSELSRESGWGLYILKLLLARTSEAGSRTLVHAGSSGEESHGKYLSDCTVTEPSAFVRSQEGKEVQVRVWEELVSILEGIKEGVTKVSGEGLF
jgi:NAD(P)-dependent dehydrogenase (short-subunit alcohol dehydrogenase family)